MSTLANGATTHATFTAQFGLATTGALDATSTVAGTTYIDPNAANNSDSASCTAITSLIITC